MAHGIPFVKMQGVGNDFVVVDGREWAEYDWSAFAIDACNRRLGVGADGLLVLDDSAVADVRMRMFNPDGTPDICGNGLRCVARYAVERGLVANDSLTVEVLDGPRDAQVLRDASGQITAVRVAMRRPHFAPSEIPILTEGEQVIDFPLPLPDGEILRLTVLSTGSTHAITFVPTLPDDERFFRISPQVENHPLFPERTSLMWCQVEGFDRLRLRIWERGAGETWGCGTGACAAAVAAILHGHAAEGDPVRVTSKGGELLIRWSRDSEIAMTGPAEFVFTGTF